MDNNTKIQRKLFITGGSMTESLTEKNTENIIENNEKEKLWTTNFLVLWQGQLVSTLGDAIYSIALGFWVLSVTGSTALMGTLMAVSMLPGIIISPFAGVIVDRWNRKRIIITADIIRGLSIVFIAIAAFSGFIEIWMVFVTGIIESTCGAFFRPSINSSIPDMVPKSKIEGANSVFSMATTGSSLIGNSSGGFLFQAIGAPFMFLFNGLSYLFSGILVFFIKIPQVKRKSEQHFLSDMKEGFSFIWRLRGLRYILIIAAIMNFFFNIVIILLMPLFQKTEELGAGKYGVAMACFMGGAMLGFILMSVLKVPPSKRFRVFVISNILMDFSIIAFANMKLFGLMIPVLIIGGFTNAIINVFIMSTIQITTPPEMRGKILSLLNMLTQGLTPFAMALGGILGGIFPIRIVMTVSLVIVFLVDVPLTLNKHFRKFINYDYQKQTLEDIM